MKLEIVILAVGILVIASLGSLVFLNPGLEEPKSEKMNVIVSIVPQKAFVQAVAEDLVNVKELIPPGGSPATYEPKPSDLALVEMADVYFRIGHIPFEKSHIDKLTELNPDMKVVDTSANVNLRHFGGHDNEEECLEHEGTWIEEHEECEYISEETCKELGGEFNACASACRNDPDAEICTLQCVLVCSFEEHHEEEHEEHEENEGEHEGHGHEGVDPHIWLSPLEVKKQVDDIAKTLSQEDPANAETYNSNAEQFKKQLDDLHTEIESQFTEINTNKLMVFHPAWGYFAHEYGLEQVAIEQSGKEPTAQELQNLIEVAKEEEIKVIFVQSQFNKEIAQSVADEVGAVVVSIDPLSEDYINNLGNVATTISESLK